jgi:putative PIN family toxin of toxin-antitoxin system
MKIVIDTNIIFSALLNTNSKIGDYLLDPNSKLEFYSPEYVLDELDKYHNKLLKYSSLTEKQLKTSRIQIFKRLTLISDNAISIEHWKVAIDILKEIDPKDTPFLATALAINGVIWTGDKKLITGLKSRGFNKIVVNTADLVSL